MLLDVFLDDRHQVFRVVEHRPQAAQSVFHQVEGLFGVLSCDGLDAADACCHAGLGHHLEHADASCALGVYTSAELARRPEANHANLVAVFLAEEGDGPHLAGFVEGYVAMLVERNVLANHLVDQPLHLTHLLVGDFLIV